MIVVYPDHTQLRFGLEGKGIPLFLVGINFVGVSMDVARLHRISQPAEMKMCLLYVNQCDTPFVILLTDYCHFELSRVQNVVCAHTKDSFGLH